ncbi:MAG: hypothetical protein ACK5LT_07420 [Lachnospirales bacterium]
MENKICISKKCKKVLPEGYTHRYCESCRNQHVETIKKTGKGLLSIAGGVASIAVVLVTKGKINPKD